METAIHSGSLAIIPNHETADPQYLDNLQTLAKKCEEAAEKDSAGS